MSYHLASVMMVFSKQNCEEYEYSFIMRAEFQNILEGYDSVSLDKNGKLMCDT